MGQLLPEFPQTASPAAASYDWFDLAEGVGYKTFYGFEVDVPSTSGSVQLLSTSAFYSDKIQLSGTTTAGVSLSGSFLTSPFNVPKDIKGDAYVSFGWYSNTNDMFPYAKIYKSVAGVDTLIGQMSGSLVADAVASLPKVTTLKVNLPLTHIAPGDAIKLEAGITAAAGGAGAFSNIGEDPLNRDGIKIKPSTQQVTTKLLFNIPFKINAVI